jgi:ankyrin repeat protein
MSDAAKVHAAWTRYLHMLSLDGETPRLGAPATKKAIASVEAAMHVRLPDDVRVLLAICDGAQLAEVQFLSIDQMLTEWRLNKELADEEEEDGAELHTFLDGERVAARAYHAAWIPIAQDHELLVFSDTAPGAKGKLGQLLCGSDGQHHVIADDLADLFGYLGDLACARKSPRDDEFGFLARERKELRNKLSPRRKAPPRGTGSLLRAAREDDLDAAKQAIAEGQDLDATDRKGNTALCVATQHHHFELAGLLIRAGADVNLGEGVEGPPLLSASYAGSVSTVTALLARGARVDATQEGGHRMTAVMLAAGAGHEAVVAALIAGSANVQHATGESQLTALKEAARGGHIEIVRRLIDAGADLDLQGPSDTHETAIMCAAGAFGAGERHLEVVKLLIARGANLELANWEGTAQDHALKRGNTSIADVLARTTGSP